MGAYLIAIGGAAVVRYNTPRARLGAPKISSKQELQFSTLTQEGSFAPLLIGRRRIGHFVGWVGDRQSIPVGTHVRSKGTRRQKVHGTPVWVESSWHVLCVGPAKRLHKVYQDGKVIWSGPVESATTPSGTALQTIAGEEFTIYWGESDQPANAFLGAAGRVGVTSQWPYLCYVVWTNKSLGNAPRWQTIEYDLETEPFQEPSALRQILFAPWPHGLNLNSANFDLDSFTDLDALLVAEGISDLSVLAQDGHDAIEAIAGLLFDMGCMLVFDVNSDGKLAARPLRQSDPTRVVPTDLLTGPLPQLGTAQEGRGLTRLVFVFDDSDREFSQSTLGIDNDSWADAQSLRGLHRSRSIPIKSATDLATAGKIAERRSQEVIDGQFTFDMNRGARLLVPGQRIAVAGIADVLRVLELEIFSDGGVKVVTTPDFYGAQASTYAAPVGGDGSAGGVDPEEDLAAAILEVPAVLAGGMPAIVVPRIRANDQVSFADLHLSGDDTTYHLVGREGSLQTGGELIDALAADDPWEIAQGPTFTLLGPDAGAAEDYSSDEASWRSGRQLCAIDDELFFLQKITAISGSTYRLDGLIRARFDTVRAAHSVGANVFIFALDALTALQDPALVPDQLLYVKPQPWTSTPLSLASVTAVSKTLYGKGRKPGPVSALRVTLPRNGVPAYYTGEDVRLAWGYRSSEAGVGAGEQPAGTPTADADIDGAFEVTVYDAGDVEVDVRTVATPVLTLTNAELVSLLGGETDFRIEVRHTRNGYRSSLVELAVEAL